MENVEKIPTERLLTKTKKDEKLRNICFELFKLRQQEQQAKEKYGELQSQLKDYFGKSGDKSLQFSVGERSYRVTDVSPKKIIWDVEKLRERLKERGVSIETRAQVIHTDYSISNWGGFCEFLSERGIKSSDVLKFIEAQRKVVQKKMDELSEIGEIKAEDIEGCYTVEQTNGYVKLSEWENEPEGD